MPNVGPMELIVILVIALIVLGPKKLPEVGRSIGKGMREFKDSVTGVEEAVSTTTPTTTAPPAELPAAPSEPVAETAEETERETVT